MPRERSFARDHHFDVLSERASRMSEAAKSETISPASRYSIVSGWVRPSVREFVRGNLGGSWTGLLVDVLERGQCRVALPCRPHGGRSSGHDDAQEIVEADGAMPLGQEAQLLPTPGRAWYLLFERPFCAVTSR